MIDEFIDMLYAKGFREKKHGTRFERALFFHAIVISADGDHRQSGALLFDQRQSIQA